MTPANPKTAGSQTTSHSVTPSTPFEDKKHSLTISEYGSISGTKKTETELSPHEDMFPGFNPEVNDKLCQLGEENVPVLFLPDRYSKPFSRKSFKKLSNFPSFKRPRANQASGFIISDNHDSAKNDYDHIRSLADERCRIVKQKHGHNSKRIDKKTNTKTKCDLFVSKAGFISSDPAAGGIEKIGLYGLKSDLQDVTKYVKELSLNELLDGSNKYTNICPVKRKKASHSNENILLSVRKACSILPLPSMVDGNGNKNALTILQDPNMPDRDEKDQCSIESSITDSCQAIMRTSVLYQPKDILEQLALPPPLDLEALILNMNPSMDIKAQNTSSLPPFPWSFSDGGTYKLGVDTCKVTLPRSAGQSKWVRIGSSFTSIGCGNNDFSGLNENVLDHTDDIANQQKLTEILEYVKSLTEPIMPPMDEPPLMTASQVPNHDEGSGKSGLLHRKLELLDGHAETFDNIKEDKSNCSPCQNSVSEVSLTCLRNELTVAGSLKLEFPFKDSEIVQKDYPKRTADDCSRNCYDYLSPSSPGGCSQSLCQSPTQDILSPGHSTQLLAAAAILWEIKCFSNPASAHNTTNAGIKSPTSQKTIKDQKSASFVENTRRLYQAPRHHDTFKRTALPSLNHKLVSEKRMDLASKTNVDGESVNWLLSYETGCASPKKLQRNHLRPNSRLLHRNVKRSSSQMQSPNQDEKV